MTTTDIPEGLSDTDLLAAYDAAVAVFARLPAGHDRTPVPACPDWDLAGLQEHVGQIHRWAGLILTTGSREHIRRDRTPLEAGADRHAFVAEQAAALRRSLTDADLDGPVWTFAGPRPARWWLRRQVHETTLHALDALDALRSAGAVGAGDFVVSPAVAVDGISELFEVFVPRGTDTAAFAGNGETLHLHATDATGEWLVRFEAGEVVVTAEHAKGDVAARGPALELLRLVWGRPTGPDLTVFGDAAVIDRFHAASRF